MAEDANVMLNGFGTLINALGKRAKPYLPQICGTIKWRLNNKAAKVRQQAADLIARIAPVLKACEEDQLLGHLGVVLYEYLGEEVRPAWGEGGGDRGWGRGRGEGKKGQGAGAIWCSV